MERPKYKEGDICLGYIGRSSVPEKMKITNVLHRKDGSFYYGVSTYPVDTLYTNVEKRGIIGKVKKSALKKGTK